MHLDRGRRTLYVHGLKRSGNHALVNWIIRQHRGRAAFLNNVEPGRSLLRPAEKVLYPLRAGGEGRGTLVVASYEDKHLVDISSNSRERRRRDQQGRVLEILLLRDPFNLFASRYRRHHRPFYRDRGHRLEVKRQWKDYAREFLGETAHLAFDRVCISYNRWVVDADYRRELSGRLGLPFTDEGIRDVPAYGGGSSFEGTASDGRADAMAVMDRWRSLTGEEAFVELFRGDTELFELSRRIFGPLPATEELAMP
jgi:hypothetical protein